MPSASLYIMVSLHVLIKKYAAVVSNVALRSFKDSGNFQQIFDAKVFNKFFHPNFSCKSFRQNFQPNFSCKSFGRNFREKFSIKFFVGLDRDAGSSKLARFGIVRGSAARDRSRRLLRLTISSTKYFRCAFES